MRHRVACAAFALCSTALAVFPAAAQTTDTLKLKPPTATSKPMDFTVKYDTPLMAGPYRDESGWRVGLKFKKDGEVSPTFKFSTGTPYQDGASARNRVLEDAMNQRSGFNGMFSNKPPKLRLGVTIPLGAGKQTNEVFVTIPGQRRHP